MSPHTEKKMPLYLYTDELRLTAMYILYTQIPVALRVRYDLEMQITVIINNYGHEQLGFITQDILAMAVYY